MSNGNTNLPFQLDSRGCPVIQVNETVSTPNSPEDDILVSLTDIVGLSGDEIVLVVRNVAIFLLAIQLAILIANVLLVIIGALTSIGKGDGLLYKINRILQILILKRESLIIMYFQSNLSMLLEIVTLCLSLTSCAMFVYICAEVGQACNVDESYANLVSRRTVKGVFNTTEIVYLEYAISIFLALQLAIHFIVTPRLTWFFLRPLNIADLLTICSGILAPSGGYLWFFMVLRFLKFYETLTFLKKWGLREAIFKKFGILVLSDATFLAVSVASLVVCAAGFLFVIENNVTSAGSLKDLYDALYFTFITITTVGYGDFSPVSTAGRVFIMFFVVTALLVIPGQTAKLVLLGDYRRTNVVTFDQFVIVYAQDGTDVTNFLQQFFHEDREVSEIKIALVFPNEISSASMDLVQTPFYESRVQCLKGSLIDKGDILRAKVKSAKAAFLLSSSGKDRAEDESRDTVALLTALTLKFYSEDLPIYLETLTVEHKIMALTRGLRNVICLAEIKMNLLASSCINPGISTLLSNMITVIKSSDFTHTRWLTKYEDGLGNEIYTEVNANKEGTKKLNLDAFIGKTFKDVVLYLFHKFSILLIGLLIKCDEDYIVFINPMGLTINEGYLGIYVAQSEKDIKHALSKSHEEWIAESSEFKNIRLSTLKISEGKIGSLVKSFAKFKGNKKDSNKKKKMKESESNSRGDKKIDKLLDKTLDSHAYELAKSLRSVSEITITEVTENILMNGHFLVIGEITPILVYFVAALRLKKLNHHLRDIPIILFSQSLPEEVWKKIVVFPNIYFIEGDQCNLSDLKKARPDKAVKIVILSPIRKGTEDISITQDAKSVMTWLLLRKYNPVVEISNPDSIRLLYVQEQLNAEYQESEEASEYLKAGPLRNIFYASGGALIPSVFETTLCQNFFNPYLVQVVEQLLQPENISIIGPISQLEGLKECKQYSDLFYAVMRNNKILLGLMRPTNIVDARFVQTSPSHMEAVDENDYVILLNQFNLNALPQNILEDLGRLESED